MSRARLPALSVEGRVDLTGLLKKQHLPGCLARLLGGSGAWQANLDLAALDGSGTLLVADASAKGFRGFVTATVHLSRLAREIDATFDVRGHGLGRPIIWFFGNKLRKSLNEAIEAFWADAPRQIDDIEAELRTFAADADQAGGYAALVRQKLWAPAT